MSAFKSKFTKYYDKILDDQNVNESKNQNLYRKLFMFKPNFKHLESSILNNSKNPNFIVYLSNFMLECVENLSLPILTESYNSYQTVFSIICELCINQNDLEKFWGLCDIVLEPTIFSKLIECCRNYMNNFNEEIGFLLISYNLIISKYFSHGYKSNLYFPVEYIIKITARYSKNCLDSHAFLYIDTLNLIIFTTLKERDEALNFLTNSNNINNTLKLLTYCFNILIEIFDDSYKIYFSRGFFEEIKTRIGYQHVNIPFIRCSNGISILNLLKSIAFLPHISAEIIGYDVFESALQKNFLFPCGKPSGLIELVFEYFSALIYSLQSPEISNNMIKTMEFCLDLIENMVTNDILAEYIYQHPPCRVLRSYFYLHPDKNINNYPNYLLACVVMFLSSQINSRLSLSIYEKYISLVYYIIDDNITTHHVQLDCDWVKLFRGIVFLCSFIARNFGSSNQKEALICLRKSFCLIDIFLTKSDKIILSTRDYDSMLYELVRNSFELQNIFDMIETCLEITETKVEATLLFPHLNNVKLVISHLMKIIIKGKEEYQDLSEDHILNLISQSLQDLKVYEYLKNRSVFVLKNQDFNWDLLENIYNHSIEKMHAYFIKYS